MIRSISILQGMPAIAPLKWTMERIILLLWMCRGGAGLPSQTLGRTPAPTPLQAFSFVCAGAALGRSQNKLHSQFVAYKVSHSAIKSRGKDKDPRAFMSQCSQCCLVFWPIPHGQNTKLPPPCGNPRPPSLSKLMVISQALIR